MLVRMKEIGDIHVFEDRDFLRGVSVASLVVVLLGCLAGVAWYALVEVAGETLGRELSAFEIGWGTLFSQPAWWVALVAAIILMFIAHELVHGFFFKQFAPQGAHVTYGANWSMGMFYASAEGVVYTRGQYEAIIIAPTIVVTFALVAIGCGLKWPLWTIILATIHLSGCTGDWGYLWELHKNPDVTHCEDTSFGVRFLTDLYDERPLEVDFSELAADGLRERSDVEPEPALEPELAGEPEVPEAVPGVAAGPVEREPAGGSGAVSAPAGADGAAAGAADVPVMQGAGPGEGELEVPAPAGQMPAAPEDAGGAATLAVDVGEPDEDELGAREPAGDDASGPSVDVHDSREPATGAPTTGDGAAVPPDGDAGAVDAAGPHAGTAGEPAPSAGEVDEARPAGGTALDADGSREPGSQQAGDADRVGPARPFVLEQRPEPWGPVDRPEGAVRPEPGRRPDFRPMFVLLDGGASGTSRPAAPAAGDALGEESIEGEAGFTAASLGPAGEPAGAVSGPEGRAVLEEFPAPVCDDVACEPDAGRRPAAPTRREASGAPVDAEPVEDPRLAASPAPEAEVAPAAEAGPAAAVDSGRIASAAAPGRPVAPGIADELDEPDAPYGLDELDEPVAPSMPAPAAAAGGPAANAPAGGSKDSADPDSPGVASTEGAPADKADSASVQPAAPSSDNPVSPAPDAAPPAARGGGRP